jgi:hypothetical protein
MRNFIYYFFLCILLMGCRQESEKKISLLPREYYRPLISERDIGVAFSSRQDSTDGIIPLIIEHEKISDAISITHEGETIIGLRLNPYYRQSSNEVIQEISLLSTIGVANIIDDPRKYRIIERLSKEKQIEGVNNNWLREWSMLRE